MKETPTPDPASAAARFARALAAESARYGVELNAATRARLLEYYELLAAWNPRLHLVAPCAPEEFATRHVLESLSALAYLPPGARVADVGSGGGLPIIPCLVARPDLQATLIEASPKKAVFLREALRHLDLRAQAAIVCARFESIPAPPAEFLTSRALERFVEMLPRLGAWAGDPATLLLYGGPALRAEIERLGWPYAAKLLPDSAQRFLLIVNRRGA